MDNLETWYPKDRRISRVKEESVVLSILLLDFKTLCTWKKKDGRILWIHEWWIITCQQQSVIAIPHHQGTYESWWQWFCSKPMYTLESTVIWSRSVATMMMTIYMVVHRAFGTLMWFDIRAIVQKHRTLLSVPYRQWIGCIDTHAPLTLAH